MWFDRAVAQDVSPAQELQQLRAALTREERISSALREVGVALGTTLDLDDLLELILGRLTELLDADRATLYLVDDAKGDLVSRVMVGSKVKSIRVKIGHGIAGTVAKTGKAIRVREAYKDSRFEPEWDLLTGYRTTCMLAAPLKNHLGRTIGVIQVLNKAQDEFTDEDEAILTTLSTQAAVAIDNSRLFLSLIQKNRQLLDTKDQLERKVRDLELLFELERGTSRADSMDALVRQALSAATRACDARGATLLSHNAETGERFHYVFAAEGEGKLERFTAGPRQALLADVMAAKGAQRFSLGASDARLKQDAERYPFQVDSVLGLALDGAAEAEGAIAVLGKRTAKEFSPEDESLLQLISANLSTAIRLFRANEERERSQRLTSIGRLLSQVIHDFKTPMTLISGYVQLMENSADAAVRGDFANKILRQFDVLTAMQREVLEFARGERSLFVRKVYLNRFFGELAEELRHEIKGKPVQLDVKIDAKVVARFDERRVSRAIHNLSRNAIEAMAERGGVLTLESHMAGDDLLIAVSDNGPGVPAEVKGRLFQSFVTAQKQGGTGLGLAIVKKIVEEHGGSVELMPTETGTRFEIRLPQNKVLAGKADGDGRASKSSIPPA